MTDMIVAGAGTTSVNGTYVEIGTANGKPQYKFGSYYLMWINSQWQIRISTLVRYISTDDVATPDLATFTITGLPPSGAAPAPTVTAASSGTTHEGEAALSSISYLRTKKA